MASSNMDSTLFPFSSTINGNHNDDSDTIEWWIAALIFGTFTGICGFIVMFMNIFSNYLALRLKYHGQPSSAIITSKHKEQSEDTDVYIIKFKYTINEIEYKGKSSISPDDYSRYQINQQIDIIYDPDNPINSDCDKQVEGSIWCGVIASFIFSFVFGIGAIIGCCFGSKLTVHSDQTSEAILGTLGFGIIVSIPYCLYKCCKYQVFCFKCLNKDSIGQSTQNEVNLAETVGDTASV